MVDIYLMSLFSIKRKTSQVRFWSICLFALNQPNW